MSSVALSALAQIATGAAMVVLARRLGSASFGAFGLVYGASLAFGGLLDFGSSQQATKALAQRGAWGEHGAWLRRRSLYQAPLVALFAALVSVFGPSNLSSQAATILAFQAFTITVAFGVLAAVRSLLSNTHANGLVFLGNIVFLFFSCATPQELLPLGATIGATSSWALTATCAWSMLRQYRTLPERPFVKNPWGSAASFGVFGIAVSLLPFDLAIVSLAIGDVASGELASVSKLTLPISLPLTAYCAVLFPRMCALGTAKAKQQLRDTFPLVGVVLVLLIVLSITSAHLVDFLLGPEYADASAVLALLAVVAMPSAINQPIVAFLQATGDERIVAVGGAVCTLGYLVGVFPLVRSFGVLGAPIAGLITQGAFMVFVAARAARR